MKRQRIGMTCALLLAGLVVPLRAAPNTWTGSGDWTNFNNWSLTHVPQNNEDVVINGNVFLTNSPALLTSFTVNASKTVTFGGWNTVLTASVVTINGTVTHTNNSATTTNASGLWVPDSRIYIHCDTIFVATNGSVSANGKGYRGGLSTSTLGCGPGGGNGTSKSGGYGGVGGGAGSGYGGAYGSVTNPVDPGSGGGGWGSAGGVSGGNGGGAIWIEATGQVTVNGTVRADGDTAYSNNGGGGSGGSIYILCGTFDGTNGTFSAKGGDRQIYSGTSGGGGRIAVIYTNTTLQGQSPVPSVRFSTAPGTEDAAMANEGDIGTLYFPDIRFLTDSIPHSGQWMTPGFTSWSPNNLTISNAWFRFPPSDFTLTVTNNITVLGSNVPLNRLDITPLLISCSNLVLTNISSVTNGSYLYLLASTNSIPGADGCGPHVVAGGTLALCSNSVIYPYSHPTNGCGIGFQAQNLTIATGAIINADTLGCRGGTNSTDNGQGKGGTLSGKTFSGGAGYGGIGGNGNGGVGGNSYGSSNAPVDSGSGTGFSTFQTALLGYAGGGLVRLAVTNRVVLDGAITANGAGPAQYGGGSSGGGIYISCYALMGRGKLSARAGAGGPNGGGGGAGGRIAVWKAFDTSALASTNVAGGTGGNANGQTGTVVWITTSAAITNLSANALVTTATLVGNLTSTGMAPTMVYCYWGTNDGVNVKTAWNTNAAIPGFQSIGQITNNVSGLAPGTPYYYRFMASNVFAETWADPVGLFSTAGGALVLDDDGGATNITCTSATLRGQLSVGNPIPATYICWGDNDGGGTATDNWDTVVSGGPLQLGPFSAAVTGLVANQTYYYRCYATNLYGGGWAPSMTIFTAASPNAVIGDASVVEGNTGTTDALFTVTLALPSATDVPIGFTTSNGTATAGSDYVASNGTLVIGTGATTGVIRVTVIGDSLDEYPGESFYMLLTNAPNAVLTRTAALGWIADDDDTPQTKTWSGSGNWNSLTNWLPASQGLPSPSDTVFIPSGTTCTISNSATVASLTVSNNGTLMFAGWNAALTTGVVTINGTITHTNNSATTTNAAGQWIPDSRVYIHCATMFIASNGSVSAIGKGYSGGVSGALDGRGPGGGKATGGGGGGYGGFGGGNNGVYAPTYGSVTNPSDPGSGGGYQINNGGNGGGAIWIEATGVVVVNGSVTANGGDAAANSPGSGSGGSIYILCATLDGTNGSISAAGGGDTTTYGSYGGGGGRIAVIYTDTVSQSHAPVPGIRFSVAPGYLGMGGYGDIGTLYFPDNRFLTETIVHNGQWTVPGFTNWSPNNLTISNAWIRFPASDFTLTATNAITVLGSNVPFNRLDLTPSLLKCNGDLTLTNISSVTNGSYLYLLASTNSIPGVDGCGPRVVVGGAMNVCTNSVIYPYSHPTNGCGIAFQMQNLMIVRGGSINADALGYRGGTNNTDNGQGKGGALSGKTMSGGAGYGGAGGDGGYGGAGSTYGSSNAPVHSGSGSGYTAFSGGSVGWAGGGIIRLSVDNRVVLDGTITANGTGGGSYGGGSSGGGIYIYCRKFTGRGNLSAQGGTAGLYGGGGGGGGRIAVWRTADTSALSSTNVAGGPSAYATAGQAGSIVWGSRAASGAVMFIQ